jgi:DNA polymerase I-like protein with 3'-5' exonuclease and polymerase domains
LWPEFEHKLQFQTFQYTREPYYKDEGKLWTPKEGLAGLQLYNCKDSAVTYEIRDKQDEDFADRPWMGTFYREIAIKRARAYYRMDDRGVLMDRGRLERLRTYVLGKIDDNIREAELLTGKAVASGSCLDPEHPTTCKCNLKLVASKHGCKQKDVFNLGSSKQVITELESRGIKIPMKRATRFKAARLSVDETTLRKIVLNNTQEKLPLSILNVRELNKMKGTYIDTRLLDDVLYTSFSPTATITFRGGSRTNIFGLGTNSQNWPKHSDLGTKFRECIIARPGKVFVLCDQRSAEDWLVQGIITDVSGRTKGLDELKSGINRHRKLASFLFGKPQDQISKESMEYYLGKKTRHAGNYDMREKTMADNLLKDGFPIPEAYCSWLLLKFHEAEPDIRAVFHKYIQNTLNTTRVLKNPLGFERIFFGLRPYNDNSDVYREGYAQIPQSTIAVNNALAIIYLDTQTELHKQGYQLLKDDHDSVTLEVDNNFDDVEIAVQDLVRAYSREIVMPNGLTFEIPIEVEIGYNLGSMKTCQDHLTRDGLKSTWKSLQDTLKVQESGITGAVSL